MDKSSAIEKISIYKCIFCSKKTHSRKRFNFHILKKHKSKLKRCDLCHVAFLDASSRTLHRNNHITRKNNVYKCSLCPKAFFNSPRLINHEPRHGINRPDDGIVCDEYRHIQSVFLPNHTNEYIGFENLFTCNICSKSFRRIKNLERHKLLHNNAMRSCKNCSLYFSNENELEQHIVECKMKKEPENKHPVLELIQCNMCEKLLSGTLNWKRHMNIHARNEAKKKYICRYCNKRFALPINLFRHFLKLHPDDEPYVCSHCCLPFKRRHEFSAHIKTHTASEQTGRIRFDSNNRIVFELNTSELHENNSNELSNELGIKSPSGNMLILSNNNSSSRDLEIVKKQAHSSSSRISLRRKCSTETVECHICGLRLGKNSLRYHIARHQLPKKLACYICSAKFQSKMRLNYHIQQHFKNDEKLCICGVRSTNILDMENHLKYHCQNNASKTNKNDLIFQDLIRKCNIESLDDDSVVIVDIRNESPPLNKPNESDNFPDSEPTLKRFSIPPNVTIKKISSEEANKRKKIKIKGIRMDENLTLFKNKCHHSAASQSPEQIVVSDKIVEQITDTVLVNVNPLAHLIPGDSLAVQKPLKKRDQDYENIIKKHLNEMDNLDFDVSNQTMRERKRYYKTKEYDYAAIIEKTLGEPVRRCNMFEQNKEINVEKQNDASTSGVAKFDYAMLVKDSIGDGINYD